MAKKINIAGKPNPRSAELAQAADAWVNAPGGEPTTLAVSLPETGLQRIGQTGGVAVEEQTKRLTLDLPVNLHRRIKTSCANRGTSMVEEIRTLLESHYAQK